MADGRQASLTRKGFTVLNGLPETSTATSLFERPCLQRFIFILFVTLFSVGLWLKPHESGQTSDYCFWKIAVTKYIEQNASCDSKNFIAPANDLSLLLGPHSRRQDRPGTILFAHFIAQPLVWYFDRFLRQPAVWMIVIKDSGRTTTMPMPHLVAYYAGFVALNFIVLRLSYILYLRAIGFSGSNRETPRGASALLGVLIFANNTTKEFLWSAHTQMFSILGTMMAVYYFKEIQNSDTPVRTLCVLAFLCGIGMLFYGLFVIPVTLICLGYYYRQRNALLDDPMLQLLPLCFAVLLFSVPYGVWYVYILHLNGAFYNYDIETFRGFQWLTHLAAEQGWGTAGLNLALDFWDMFRGAFSQGWGFLLLLGSLMIAARDPEMKRQSAPLWIGAGLYALSTAVFFSLYGITPLRLSYQMGAAIFPVIGLYVRHLEEKTQSPGPIYVTTIAGLLFYVVFMVMKFGPYGPYIGSEG